MGMNLFSALYRPEVHKKIFPLNSQKNLEKILILALGGKFPNLPNKFPRNWVKGLGYVQKSAARWLQGVRMCLIFCLLFTKGMHADCAQSIQSQYMAFYSGPV